ncbi:MAG: LysR family transcriptional regulator [Verrucomicrobiaceae bacterium]|nr:MAG: LysR family transcriptional regulator [Verrucomicrobiaceae bacterium]
MSVDFGFGKRTCQRTVQTAKNDKSSGCLDARCSTAMFHGIVKDVGKSSLSRIEGLPAISLRQLEIFRTIFEERSFTNAALDLRSTRANIKRICDDFSNELGHPLFDEDVEKNLRPTPFAIGLISQMAPLSRSLRRLNDEVKTLHHDGRLVRFAAAGGFFGESVFTEFLSLLDIRKLFRTCFVKMDPVRYRTALLNAECDVYFGCGLIGSDRLELVDLGSVPWKFSWLDADEARPIHHPGDLPEGEWEIGSLGDPEALAECLDALHQAGAKDGRISGQDHAAARVLLEPDITGAHRPAVAPSWPCHRFSAILRKHHPYVELKTHLAQASVKLHGGHGS